jgi:hypothetical protein
VKTAKIVYPTHPLIIRKTEYNIGECRLVHVSDRDARIVAEAHANFLKGHRAEVGSEETEGLTVRQARLLGQPSIVYLKRKGVKIPAESRGKKIAKTKSNTGPRKPRKPKVSKKLLEDLTEEEKEKAELVAALEKVAALQEKEKELENTYDSGIDPKEFVDMYSKLPPRNDPQTLADQQTLYGPVNGKTPDNLGNRSVFTNYEQRKFFCFQILQITHAMSEASSLESCFNKSNIKYKAL